MLFSFLTQCFYPLMSLELVSPGCGIVLNGFSSIEINKNTSAAHENISCAFVFKESKYKNSTIRQYKNLYFFIFKYSYYNMY